MYNVDQITAPNDNFVDLDVFDSLKLYAEESSSSQIELTSNDQIILNTDDDSTSTGCTISNAGDLDCDGSKNWIHELNATSEAVYSSQESPQVRAVIEGTTTVREGSMIVDLPYHFSQTISDSRPALTVQVTPHSLATTAVTDRSESSITIEADRNVSVDYRVTGIREGYEDKQVVRE